MKLHIELESAAELYELRGLLLGLAPLVTPDSSVDSLDLMARTANCLKAENIMTIQQLVQCTAFDLLKTPNFSRKSLEEVECKLKARGLHLQGTA